jgi:hypothetical protein
MSLRLRAGRAAASQLAFEFAAETITAPRRVAPRDALPIVTFATREERLRDRIGRALEADVHLVLTDNRRRMISSRRWGERLEVRLHHMFVDAPDAVIEELLVYLSDGDPSGAAVLRRFIAQNRDRITARSRRLLLRTRGEHHDLAEIFGEVSRDFFAGEDTDAVRVTWGRLPAGKRRRSIRFGTYVHDHALIRIHPALDQAFVPRFFVAFVVFHELLHHVVPAKRTASRVDYHPREFRARERAHPDYARTLAWEETNLDALLRWRP